MEFYLLNAHSNAVVGAEENKISLHQTEIGSNKKYYGVTKVEEGGSLRRTRYLRLDLACRALRMALNFKGEKMAMLNLSRAGKTCHLVPGDLVSHHANPG